MLGGGGQALSGKDVLSRSRKLIENQAIVALLGFDALDDFAGMIRHPTFKEPWGFG